MTKRPHVSSDAVSSAGRIAHDLGVAAIFGGNLFARVGLHPAIAAVNAPSERGEVVNAAWRRYGVVNGLGLAAVVAGWAGARADEARLSQLSARERPLALAKDAAIAALAASGIASAVAGVRFSRMEPDGAVPLRDGSEAGPEATDAEQRSKRALNLIGAVNLAAAAVVVAANSALGQSNFRRPPLRRLLRRRY
jgi:hypothetical protein